MAELVSVVGGLYAGVSLDPSEVAAAQSALNVVSKGFSMGAVHSDLSQSPNSKTLNIYDIQAASGKTYVQKTGEQVVILQGAKSATLTGLTNATNNLLVGDNGNDTINAAGGSGTIVLGTGTNQVNVNGGTETIQATGNLAHKNHLNLSGNDTINYNFNATGTNEVYVTVAGGTDKISTNGKLSISVTGSSSLSLTSGNDTVTAAGSATVRGGTGTLNFTGGLNSSVAAGSGKSTMIGGGGSTKFYGGTTSTAYDSMVGGSGKNVFQGGAGHDTMVSGASKGSTSDIFEFASTVKGGAHTIVGYTSSTDSIDLQGYTSTDVSKISMSGTDTIIKLDDGSSITVKNATVTLAQLKFT